MADGIPPRGDTERSSADYADAIDLFEYWNVLWSRRWMVIGVAILCALLAGAFAFFQPDVYRSEILLVAVEQEGAGLSGGLLGGLGGLGALAGVSLGGGGGAEEHLAVLKSRDFIWAFVRERQLLSVLFADDWDAERGVWVSNDPEEQPNLWDAYRLFTQEGLLSVPSPRRWWPR